jgi:hypothetical protein
MESRNHNINPLPQTDINTPIIRTGNVEIDASVYDGCKNKPFAGVFNICKEENNTYKCTPLITNGFGTGKVTVSSGKYSVYPPLFCPPGMMCIADKTGIQLAPLYNWQVTPGSFFLNDRAYIKVKAKGEAKYILGLKCEL